jgi:hypothetical protein
MKKVSQIKNNIYTMFAIATCWHKLISPCFSLPSTTTNLRNNTRGNQWRSLKGRARKENWLANPGRIPEETS